jgi:hypothetical protein
MALSFGDQYQLPAHRWDSQYPQLNLLTLVMLYPLGTHQINCQTLSNVQHRAPLKADPVRIDASATTSHSFNLRRQLSTKHYSVTTLLSVTEEA